MGERDHFLHGADDVRAAANSMRSAADTMSSAAGSMRDAADRIVQADNERAIFLDQWLERFEKVMRCVK